LKAPAPFPERAGALTLSTTDRNEAPVVSCVDESALNASIGGFVPIGSIGAIRPAPSRLQGNDPRMLRGRYQHDAFGRPEFDEEVGGDEEGDRKRRHQRRTCELITNAHLGRSAFRPADKLETTDSVPNFGKKW
jgi:hypothetical protein